MKTITAQQAVEQFGEYAQLAHDGEKVLVTLKGKPWVVLAPPAIASAAKQGDGVPQWPDFGGRLKPYYPALVEGPAATELLAQDKEDRF